MKPCTKCQETKPLEEFGAAGHRKDGRRSDCKACQAAAARERRARDPESARAYDRQWKAANRDKARASFRRWRAANVERERERARIYHAERPHVAWVARYRVRVRALGVAEIVEDFTRADVVDRYGDACAHCGGPFEELDHYPVPVAQGGPHTLDNVRPSCAGCNRAGGGVRRAS